MSNETNPGSLGYIRDGKQPIYVGIRVHHDKDPYMKQPVQCKYKLYWGCLFHIYNIWSPKIVTETGTTLRPFESMAFL